MTGRVEGSKASLELLGGAGHSGAKAAIPLIGRWGLEDQVRVILGYIASFGIHETLYHKGTNKNR